MITSPDQLSLSVRLLRAGNRFFARVYHHVEILAPCPMPRHGPAILVCNHTSALDPHLIQSVCPRLITWMMAKEYYEIPAIKPALHAMGIIPVTRSGRDMSATRAAMRALERGQVLGVFPEGRIESSRELLPFQTGVAMMALKTGVAVFPAYLDGTQRGRPMLDALLRRQRARIAFGERVGLQTKSDSRGAHEAATSAIETAVAMLKKQVEAKIAGSKDKFY